MQPSPITRETLEALHDIGPETLDAVGRLLASKRRHAEFDTFLDFVLEHADLAGQTQYRETSDSVARLPMPLATAVALAMDCAPEPGTLPLDARERRIMERVLAALAQRPSDMRQDLLAELVRLTDRTEAVRMVFDAGGVMVRLNSKGRVMDGRRILFEAIFAESKTRGRIRFAIGAEMARYLLSNQQQLTARPVRESINTLVGLSGSDGTRWFARIVRDDVNRDPSSRQLPAAMSFLQALEQTYAPSQRHEVRLRTLDTYLQVCAERAIAWDAELIDYLLCNRDDWALGRGGPRTDPADTAAMRRMFVPGSPSAPGITIANQVVANAYLTHCAPVLQRYAPILAELSPLRQMATVVNSKFPFDEERWQQTVEVLRTSGALAAAIDPARQGDRGPLHTIASVPSVDRAWIPRMLDLGFNPEVRDNNGQRAEDIIRDERARREFVNLVRSWQARQAAADVLETLECNVAQAAAP